MSDRPSGFPPWIALHRGEYRNWSGALAVSDVLTCTPRSADDVVDLANWAVRAGYRLRPVGKRHNWSPLVVTAGTTARTKVVLVDTTRHLTGMALSSASPPQVTVETGATVEALLEHLHRDGFGLVATPAPGDLTIGGVLAVGAHGAAAPALGERRPRGGTYGSLANLVVRCTAVVWNDVTGAFELRAYDRVDADADALLVHLGRAFITSVTLQVTDDVNLRCTSTTSVAARELFAPSLTAGPQSFASHLDRAGRVEAIWFPFTDHPWLKVWSVEPTKPRASRRVRRPYNYRFSDRLPREVAHLVGAAVTRKPSLAPRFGQATLRVTARGLRAFDAGDLWGPSKNLLLYVRPTTVRMTANGYAVLTSRDHVQDVVATFTRRYRSMLHEHAARNAFPITGPLEIRVTGLDQPGDLDAVPGARAAALSALSPRSDGPEWDVAVWFNILTFPGGPGLDAFNRALERWLFATFVAPDACVRPEWSKGWAYGPDGAWTDDQMIERTIPDLYRTARTDACGWDGTVRTLGRHDPAGVFSNDFLDRLLR